MKFPRERTGESRFFFCQDALRKNLRSQVFSFGRKAAGRKKQPAFAGCFEERKRSFCFVVLHNRV
tara:strand:+ start:280 stop:474 length:195 start_codon:yes stop_codon:yes gene_type:complete